MKRQMCGMFVLAATAGLWACSGDPTGDFVGQDVTIQSNPTSIFLPQGSSKEVIISVTDAQGNGSDITDFSVTAASGGISVQIDSTYLNTSVNPLGTGRRLFVTGASPGASSFTITANGKTLDVPVKVTPTGTTVTLSNAAPAANEGLVITLPAGYKFGAGASASVNDAPGIVQSVSADSSSLTVLLPPGQTGAVTVDGVAVDFAPGVLFSLPTSDSVAVGAVTPLSGTGAPGSAPSITIGDVGTTTAFYDGGTFDYPAPIFEGAFGLFPSRLYKITVAAPTTLTVALDWPSPEDLGIYFFNADAVTETGDAFDGSTAPEGGDVTLAPGTYYMAIVNFNETNPPYFSLSVTTGEPPAAE